MYCICVLYRRWLLAQGLCVVLENRLTHPILKELLPLLANHIHDSSEKVRIALLDLLILVKGMKAIKVSGWEQQLHGEDVVH